MMKLWSFINGLLAIPLGFYEAVCWMYSLIQSPVGSYPLVNDIWFERTVGDIWWYALGEWTFLCLPAIIYTAGGLPNSMFWFVYLPPASFCILCWVTLFVPLGERRRYKHPWFRWMYTTAPTGHERLFLGMMTPAMLLSARDDGIVACLWELLSHIFVIGLAGAFLEYAIYLADKESFIDKGAGTLFDFGYWAMVTLATVGYGDMHPVSVSARAVAFFEILFGWMYIIALLPTLLSKIVSQARSGDA